MQVSSDRASSFRIGAAGVRASVLCLLSLTGTVAGAAERAAARPRADVIDFDLTQLLSTSFFPVARIEAPSMLVDRVDVASLRRRGIRSLGEYLHMQVPTYGLFGAVSTTSGGAQGGGVVVGVRGIVTPYSSAKTLVLSDGIAVNTVNKGGYSAGRLMSPLLGDIAYVEAAAGPGSVVHGSGAISGFLNMETATGRDRRGLWALAERTAGEGLRTEISLGHMLDVGDGVDLFLYAGYAAGDGLPTRAFSRALPQEERRWTADERDRGFLRPHWKGTLHLRYGDDSSAIRFRLLLRYSRTSLGYAKALAVDPHSRGSYSPGRPLLIPGQDPLGSQAGTATQGVLLAPRFALRLSDDEELEVVGSWRRDETACAPSDWLNAIVEDLRIDHRSAMRAYSPSELESDRRLRLMLRSSRLGTVKIALGGEISHQKVEDDSRNALFVDPRVDNSTSTSLFTLELADRTFGSLFGEAIGELGPISLFLGARLDRAGQLRGRDYWPPKTIRFKADALTSFVPRMVLAWEAASEQVFKLGYQEAFRNPTPNDYSSWHARLVPQRAVHGRYAPPLQAERAQYFDFAYHTDNFLLHGLSFELVTTYTINRSTLGHINWISLFPEAWENEGDTDRGWSSVGNEGRITRSVGADMVVRYRRLHTEAKLIYDYTRPVLNQPSRERTLLMQWDGKAWNAFPAHLLKLHISHTLGPCTVTLAVRAQSGVIDRGSAETPRDASNQLPTSWFHRASQWQTDLAVALQLLPALHLVAFAKNIGTRIHYRRSATTAQSDTVGLAGKVLPGPDVPMLGLALQYREPENEL